MVSSKVTMNEFSFPEEIKDLVTNLTDEKQWKILEFLIQNDNELSYTQLREKLEIPEEKKSKFTYHLKELQKAGWLRNWLKPGTETADRQKSYYRISEFGLKIIEGAMKAMEMSSYSTSAWTQLQESIAGTPTTSILTGELFIPALAGDVTIPAKGIKTPHIVAWINEPIKEGWATQDTNVYASTTTSWDVASTLIEYTTEPFAIQPKTTTTKKRIIEELM